MGMQQSDQIMQRVKKRVEEKRQSPCQNIYQWICLRQTRTIVTLNPPRNPRYLDSITLAKIMVEKITKMSQRQLLKTIRSTPTRMI